MSCLLLKDSITQNLEMEVIFISSSWTSLVGWVHVQPERAVCFWNQNSILERVWAVALPRYGSNPDSVTPGKDVSFWAFCLMNHYISSAVLIEDSSCKHAIKLPRHQGCTFRLLFCSRLQPGVSVTNICIGHLKSSRKHSVLFSKLYVRGDLDITLAHIFKRWKRC